MENPKKLFYNKYCVVPECRNTVTSAPDKLFFPIPKHAKIRKQWCIAMRRDKVSNLLNLYCCEDHFNIEEDTTNYDQYNILKQQGEKVILLLKEGVVPHIFQCQNRSMPSQKGMCAIERQTLINKGLSKFDVKGNALESDIPQARYHEPGPSQRGGILFNLLHKKRDDCSMMSSPDQSVNIKDEVTDEEVAEKGEVADQEEMADEDMFDVHQIKQESDSETESYDSSINDPSTSDPLRSPDAIKLEPQISEPMNSEACRICGHVLAFNVQKVCKKGLTTLQMYSEMFQDNKFPPGVYPVQIHGKCRTKYSQGISKKKLEAEIRKHRRNLSNFSNEEVMTAIPQYDSEILQSDAESMESLQAESGPELDPESSNHSPLGRPGYCQICDQPLNHDVITVHSRGLPTLQRASDRLRDGKFPPGDYSVMLHGDCRAKYASKGAETRRRRWLNDSNGEATDLPQNDSEILQSESMETESLGTESVGSEAATPNPPPNRPGYCRICDCALVDDVRVVGAVGLATLQRASAARQDGKFPPGPETAVPVHGRCRLRYIEAKTLAAFVKRRLRAQTDPAYAEPAKETFDYHEQCLLCGAPAGADFVRRQQKYAARRRNTVLTIMKKSTVAKLYQSSLDGSGPGIEAIRERIKDKDLIALNARYHKLCYGPFVQPPKFPTGEPRRPRGRRVEPDTLARTDRLLDYINNNREDSQFSLDDIYRATGINRKGWGRQVIAEKLAERYKVVVGKKDIVVADNDIDLDAWHEQKVGDKKTERLRIVRAAANIILEDIRSVVLDDARYPAVSKFLDDDSIPESLKMLLDTVVTKYKKNPEEYEATATALGHSIMAAARPRTFKSPLLLGIGSIIHQKYASKSLIDLLSSVGFCASYKDVLKFEMSVACHEQPRPKPEFTQFVFDSVDTQTDGYTGQSLVGVRCDTPRTTDSPITRVDRVPSSIVTGSCDAVPLQKYTQTTSGLKDVLIEDHKDDTATLPTKGDTLWLFGKNDPDLELPGWDAFMAKMSREKNYPVSEIRALPVIFAPVSNDSIYTALKQAQEKTKPKRTCLVTFDQPLYQKAQDIVKSDSSMSNIVLRLGGFHLMTSFLGAIGYVMSGSGLKELWCSIYAAEQTEKMMTGHAYARAMKAHFLTRSALFKIITKDFDLTPDDKLEIEGILDGGMFCIPQTDNQGVKRYQEPLAITLELLEKHGPTAKLWIQYFRMTTLVAQFVEAERTADWDLHLSTLRKMLPHFHASGNFEYAKSCTLYLQDMQALESKMSAEEYEKFTKKGYFAVRRTDKVWADDWSDRAVEEAMTNVMKRAGENNGRRTTDGVLTRFISAGPLLSTIADLIEEFCRPAQNETTEPCDKSNEDITKIRSWFEEHNPFLETENLVSIATGVLGRDVNCHDADEIGKRMMAEQVGQNFQDVSYQRDQCVRPLSADKSAIQIENFKVPIEPDTILRRIQITDKNKERVKPYFKYQLSPYPLSLFNEHEMLKADKSALFELFVPVDIADGKRSHVIDGEYLLHRVKWEEDADVLTILNSYTEHVKTNFTNAVVVFDRSGSRGTTTRNKTKTEHPTIDFQKSTVLKTSRENFLSNQNNKAKLIQYLLIHLMCSGTQGINVKLTSDDVDSLIVKTAIDNASLYDETCVVSDNVDLLAIMCARANKKNVYFMKPGRGKTPTRYYHVDSLRSTKIKVNILFIHAFSGCDTTSAIFQQDKMKVASAVESMSSKEIKDLVMVFRNPKSDRNAVAKVGENVFRHLYGLDKLNDGRYDSFKKLLSRSKFDLASLPPSKEACAQHTYRTFHQVQNWLGNDLPASDWGWESIGNRLEPVTTSNVDLKELLDLISCKCDGICSEKCVCKCAGLDCCVLCLNCNGKGCHGVDMDTDAYGTGYATLSGCDIVKNPSDPPEVNDEDDSDDEDEEPRPSSPKRLRKDAVLDENTQSMSQTVSETVDEERVEVEQVYLVEQNDDTDITQRQSQSQKVYLFNIGE